MISGCARRLLLFLLQPLRELKVLVFHSLPRPGRQEPYNTPSLRKLGGGIPGPWEVGPWGTSYAAFKVGLRGYMGGWMHGTHGTLSRVTMSDGHLVVQFMDLFAVRQSGSESEFP